MRPIGLLTLLFSIGLFGQFHRIERPGKWVDLLPIEGLALKDTSCSSGGIDHLLVDRQYHLGGQHMFSRMVTRLNTAEAVQNGSRMEVDIDPSYQQLALHWVKVIRNGVVIDRLDPSRIEVLQRERDMDAFLYDGTRTIVLELHDVRPGDLIDQAYTRTGFDASNDERFYAIVQMGYSVPVAQQHVRFIVPEGRKLRWKGHLFNDASIQRTTQWGNEHIYREHHLPCVIGEAGTPGWYSPYPYLQVSEFTSVEALRAWALDRFKVDMRPGPLLDQEIAELGMISDPIARIDSAVSLVQRQVRYLGLENGISAYRPKPPAQVFEQRFGDCKDQSLLLVTILNGLGVEAVPALVNTSAGAQLDQRLPQPGLFDHCIVAIEHEGERYWVDPTMAHVGGGLRDRSIHDMGHALIVDPAARKGFEKMQVDEMSTVSITEEYTLDSLNGGAELEVETRYTRREADKMRSWLAGQSIRQVSEQYLDFYRMEHGEGEILTPVQVIDDRAANILVLKEHYHLPSIWDSVATDQIETSIQTNFLKGYVDAPDQRVRYSPYALQLPIDVTQKIIVHMPEDWPLEIEPHSFAGNGVLFESRVTNTGPLIEMNYHYRSDQKLLLPEEMPAYHAQQQQILESLGVTLTYQYGATLAMGDHLKAYGILLFILAAGIMGAVAIHKWDPEPHPYSLSHVQTNIGGWMILPLIGLVISPFRLLYDMFSDGGWILEAPLYVPLDGVRNAFVFHLFNNFTIIQNIGMLCFVVVTAVLFFQRRSNVPTLMKAMYLITFASLAIDMFMYDWLYINTVSGTEYNSSDVARAMFAAMVWVPFFHYSKRVHTTFVTRRRKDPMRIVPIEQYTTTATVLETDRSL